MNASTPIGSLGEVRNRLFGSRSGHKDGVVRYAEGSRFIERRSGCATEVDDRQMLPVLDVADRESKPVATRTAATRSVRPFRSRLQPSPSCGSTLVNLMRGFSCERRVRPLRVVPEGVQLDFPAHGRKRGWNEKAPQAFVFHRSDEALDDGDARRLADGPVARPNASSLAPALEAAADPSFPGQFDGSLSQPRRGQPERALARSARSPLAETDASTAARDS